MARMQLPSSIAFLALIAVCSAQGLFRVCYYDNTAQYRPTLGRFFPEDIEPAHCSHVIFSKAFLRGGDLTISEFNDEEMYQRVMALRNDAPDMKVLLAVETANGQLSELTSMLTDESSRAAFIDNALLYLTAHGFDGISLDFEYPGSGDSPPEDKERFSIFVQEMRAAFDASSSLLLGAAVPARRELVENGYEPLLLSLNVDFLSVMAMELHNPWEQNVTGHNAPLLSRPPFEETIELSVEFAMAYWASFGVSRSKLLMGTPLYGITFALTTSNIGVGAPANGPGRLGPETRRPGYLSYYEICRSLTSGNPQAWDNIQKVPYMADIADGQDRWTSFENQESLLWKVDHMNTRGYGGYAVRSLDMDDFRGNCRLQRYYLLKFYSDSTLEIPTTTTSTTTSTPQPVTSEGPSPAPTTESPENPVTTTANIITTEVTTEADLPVVTTESEEVPVVTTDSEELPEVTTDSEELPDITTEGGEFPEITTEAGEVPEVTTESGGVPIVSTEGGEVPEVTTDSEELPEVTTEGGEFPELTTEGGEVPEVTTESGEVPAVTTESGEVPVVTTESGEVPVVTTESGEVPVVTTASTTPFPDDCEDLPNGFMKCHATLPNYFWTCDNGVPVLRECAPGTVCNADIGACISPDEREGNSFLSWIFKKVKSLSIV